MKTKKFKKKLKKQLKKVDKLIVKKYPNADYWDASGFVYDSDKRSINFKNIYISGTENDLMLDLK